jgi:membrane protease YdiL (CAAX protease family)
VYYVLALVTIPILLQVGAMVTRFSTGSLPNAPYTIFASSTMTSLAIALTFVSHLLNSGGVAEEPGWRGFALKRMQTRLNPLAAGLIVGFLWALWHIPVMMSQLEANGPIIVIMQVLSMGIAFAWLYNRTQGSILAVALLHASWNTGVSFLPRTQAYHIIMLVLVILLVLLDRMWQPIGDGGMINAK